LRASGSDPVKLPTILANLVVIDAKDRPSSYELDQAFTELRDTLENIWFEPVWRAANLIRYVAWIARVAVAEHERNPEWDLGNNVSIIDYSVTRRLDPQVEDVIANARRPERVASGNLIAAEYCSSDLGQCPSEGVPCDIDRNAIEDICLKLLYFFSYSLLAIRQPFKRAMKSLVHSQARVGVGRMD
jgi:hypothetical protein